MPVEDKVVCMCVCVPQNRRAALHLIYKEEDSSRQELVPNSTECLSGGVSEENGTLIVVGQRVD